MLEIYWLVATFVALWALLGVDTRLPIIENTMGSMLLALFTGWLLWPVFVTAAWKCRERRHRDRPAYQ